MTFTKQDRFNTSYTATIAAMKYFQSKDETVSISNLEGSKNYIIWEYTTTNGIKQTTITVNATNYDNGFYSCILKDRIRPYAISEIINPDGTKKNVYSDYILNVSTKSGIGTLMPQYKFADFIRSLDPSEFKQRTAKSNTGNTNSTIVLIPWELIRANIKCIDRKIM